MHAERCPSNLVAESVDRRIDSLWRLSDRINGEDSEGCAGGDIVLMTCWREVLSLRSSEKSITWSGGRAGVLLLKGIFVIAGMM